MSHGAAYPPSVDGTTGARRGRRFRRGLGRVERAVLGSIMTVAAFAMERVLLRAIRRAPE